ncbi:hypothetical protein [Bifidobacterium biavatii]|uniref:Uncharacterized protein n=1 Tax=Bifidobacterium biavatii DSM 23969 TaxID=1437608 RepID=A0A086ZKG4_9BIFI|nr:hypothetical protein [Bifidobacterium biavatii]KFI47014.1 hypothetical protein BBIA_2381 [Bifidobacterium biavatii DSM 23969]
MSSEDKSNNNASPDATNKWFQADAFMRIVNSVTVILLAGICSLIASLPLVIVALVVNDLNYWPLYLAVGALSAPAVAALYAMFRDHPALSSHASRVRIKLMTESGDGTATASASTASAVNSPAFGAASNASTGSRNGGDRTAFTQQDGRSSSGRSSSGRSSSASRGPHGNTAAFLPDWIAMPYVRQDVAVAFFKPYFAAYRALCLRAWAQGCTFAIVAFALGYDILLLAQMPWGVYVVPALAVVLLFVFAAFSISMVLIVEYPKAKYLSVLKNSALLSVRRLYILLITAVALVAYGYALFRWFVPVAVLGTGVLWYLVWGASRWQAQLMFSALAAESRDDRIIAMYQVAPASSGISGFLKGTTEWRQ